MAELKGVEHTENSETVDAAPKERNTTIAGRDPTPKKNQSSDEPERPKLNNSSIIGVPISQSDIDSIEIEPSQTTQDTAAPGNKKVKRHFWHKERESKKSSIRIVQMPRAVYLKYFAKDGHGNYTCSEPRESGMWKVALKRLLEDTELQKLRRDDTRKFTWMDEEGESRADLVASLLDAVAPN